MSRDKIFVSPSILSADFANLALDIKKVEEAGADWIHVDVMDGLFVPNITIGAPVVKALRRITKLPLDVHLMIEKPQRYIKDFVDAGSDIITVHYEACEDCIDEVIEQIKLLNVKVGVSIKPKTPAIVLKSIISKIDLVLVMTVEPGFGGQKFINDCLSKIREIKLMIQAENRDIYLEVDGGVDDKTSKRAVEAGADCLVAGSYIYKASDIAGAIKSLKQNTP